MEYEKTEVNSGFFYKSADEREKLVSAERKFIEDRVKKVIEFKKNVCAGDDKKSFVIINQKGEKQICVKDEKRFISQLKHFFNDTSFKTES